MITIALNGLRGGVGTSATVAGIAHAAWQAGRRVLALGLCPNNQLALHFGLSIDAAGWRELADPASQWQQALHTWQPGLDLLPHGQGSEPGSPAWLSAISGYDLLLLDLPVGGVAAADRRLTLLHADANCHVRLFQHKVAAGERLLVTQFDSSRALQQDLMELWRQGSLPLLNMRLHRDEAMAEAMALKQPVGAHAPDSLIAHELAALAQWCLAPEGHPC
ncbi:cellulose synthase operon protein YhjQ/BcsQ [Aeromonas diversa]|uniref:cellulose synthase operon protein YhjQ/BcsQ n=1 Tax=Aeromonas diversa TaxID=502790 RepID=UPI0039A1D27B